MKISKRNGPAGQVSYTAETEDGPLTFVGSVYGGHIVMVTPSGQQTFVSDPGRFASGPNRFGNILDEDWVRNFLAEEGV
jgi:hypothetical protein